MTSTLTLSRRIRPGALAAALLVHTVLATTAASATQILDAADHAELAAQVSATGVSRVALMGDRIARVIRAPGGFRVEHDPGSGDLYLRPLPAGTGSAMAAEPVALFVGSEKGFTYRLTLTPAARGPAQILIRNPDLAAVAKADAATEGDPRIAAIAHLVRAVANREPLAGYTIEAGGDSAGDTDARVVEAWRGPRFTALVIELGADVTADAAALAARLGPGIAAVWLADAGAGPSGGRLAVAVREGDLR